MDITRRLLFLSTILPLLVGHPQARATIYKGPRINGSGPRTGSINRKPGIYTRPKLARPRPPNQKRRLKARRKVKVSKRRIRSVKRVHRVKRRTRSVARVRNFKRVYRPRKRPTARVRRPIRKTWTKPKPVVRTRKYRPKPRRVVKAPIQKRKRKPLKRQQQVRSQYQTLRWTPSSKQTIAPRTTTSGKEAKTQPMEKFMDFPLALPSQIKGRFGWRTTKGLSPKFHRSLTIEAKEGAQVVAVYSGKVISAGEEYPYGQTVLLSHKGGSLLTRYSPCSNLFTRPGMLVNRGQGICEIGRSDTSATPYLRFEQLVLQSNGSYKSIDPLTAVNIGLVRLTQRLHQAKTLFNALPR